MQHSPLSSPQLYITDAKPVVIRNFVKYLYTDNLPEDSDALFGLLVLADKYNVAKLKFDAEARLVMTLSVGNAKEFQALAEHHGAKGLEEAAGW